MDYCFDVCEQQVTCKSQVDLVNKSIDYLSLSFTFKGTAWNDLEKHVLFSSVGDDVYDLELDNAGKVVVPYEVLTGDYFIFSLYGLGADDYRITCNMVKVYLGESGFVDDGVAPQGNHKTVIAKVYEAIDEVDTALTTLSNLVDGYDIPALKTLVNSLSDDVVEAKSTVARLDGTVTGFGRDLSALDGTVTGLSGDVTGLDTAVTGLSGDLSSLDGTVTSLSDTVGSLDDSVDGLSDTVTSLSGTVDGLGDSVTTLSGTVDGISDDIGTINGKLANTIEMTVNYPDGTSATFDVVVKE